MICKFFNEALTKCQYNYDWGCPNGKKCVFKHFISKECSLLYKKKKDIENLEEVLEYVRYELVERVNLTPIKSETFLIWKEIMDKKKKKRF